MRWFTYLLTLGILCGSARGQEELQFSLQEGGQSHHFYQSPQQAFHLLLRPANRLICAFPGGNSGLALWWQGATLNLESPPNSSGEEVRFSLQGVGKDWRCQGLLLDSIRLIRDREALGAQALKTIKPQRRQEQFRLQGQDLQVTRLANNGKSYQLRLQLAPPARWRPGPRGWSIQSPGSFRLALQLRNAYPALPPLADHELLRPHIQDLAAKLPPPEALRFQKALRGLKFLSSQEKYLAGSWRFLTYFGRDTAMSALMLRPILQPQALRAARQSLLARLSPDGQVAHEESIGCWPAGSEPEYDYNMVDDDFMLALLSQEAPASPELLKNYSYVLKRARAWPELVAIKEGSDVGDWRDSREGMGWGRYSFSVNGVLVPAALRAIADQGHGTRFPDLPQIQNQWNQSCSPFRVQLSPEQVRQRLQGYLLSLSQAERSFYLGRPVGEGGPTLEQFLQGSTAPALAQGLSFHALSLDRQLQPVEVMNSDDSFLLFLGQPTLEQVEQTLRLLELEFPLGLMTGVGPVVANPAYSLDPRHVKELHRGAYHGSVIWGWQSSLMMSGLLRQRQLFPSLQPRIDRVLEKLWRAEQRARQLANSELWTFSLEQNQWQARAFGSGTAQIDESNPVQLWSCTYPALVAQWLQAGLAIPRD